jgi:predicted aconitase with swiveling domain
MTGPGPDLTARTLHPGTGAGEVLLLSEPLSLWGGSDPETGRITDKRHPQYGETLAGRVLVMPASRGSSSSASVLAEQLRRGVGPAAIIVGTVDTIVAVGALVAHELYTVDVPVVHLDITRLPPSGHLTVRAGHHTAVIETS